MSTRQKEPTRKELLKEYEFCQNTAQRMEATIWQTNAAMGIGFIGTLLLIGIRSINQQPPWPVAAMIGVFSTALSIIWWFMAKRWWSIQHAMFLRMRHIEEDLGLHSARYVNYLDFPCTIPSSGLTKKQIKDLKERSGKRTIVGHQKLGVQKVLVAFPFMIAIAWVIYISWLYTQ